MQRVVTIIIATRNRAKALAESLNGVLNQEVPSEYRFELIVVDNNSSDNTRAVIEGMTPPSGWTIKYLFEAQPGKSRCMNKAIDASTGDPLIFTDDDTAATSGWIASVLDCFDKYSCDAVGGRVLPVYPPGIPDWVKKNAKILDGPIVYYDHGTETLPLEVPAMSKFIGANMSFRREMFKICGYFNVELGPGMKSLGDDTEFMNRLIKNKRKLFYCGQALVWHPVDPKRVSFRYFAQWGHWAGQYYALTERPQIKERKLSMLFGAPRYLWIRTLKLGLSLLVTCNRSSFLEKWIKFHLNRGMINRHRELSKKDLLMFARK